MVALVGIYLFGERFSKVVLDLILQLQIDSTLVNGCRKALDTVKGEPTDL